MTRIGKSWTFEAAHRLQNHDGKCRNLHGHSYRVEVAIEGTIQEPGYLHSADGEETGIRNPMEGMVLDFSRLNKWWADFEPFLDHRTILQINDPLITPLQNADVQVSMVSWPPTAENLATWLKDELSMWLMRELGESVIPTPAVRVYETAKSWAEG